MVHLDGKDFVCLRREHFRQREQHEFGFEEDNIPY